MQVVAAAFVTDAIPPKAGPTRQAPVVLPLASAEFADSPHDTTARTT